MLPHFDLAFAASAIDAVSLSAQGGRLSVVPNVAPAGAKPGPRQRFCRRRTILFVGSMGYAPNDDAARWLLTRIWPRLRRANRTPVRLVLLGSNPSPSLVRLGGRSDVRVTGTVADVAAYYRHADLVVIPVRAGGGTRIKLLEAAAHALPIVSTTLGAEGTAFRHGHELLLADSADGFARACVHLLQNRAHASRLAGRARATVCRDHDAARWARFVGELVLREGAK
jgi:glycosyltransferase involved in cell wall biosynthesis